MADNEIPESKAPGYQVEGNDTEGYVGVSPEYQTYAEEISKPFVGEDEQELYDDVKLSEEEKTVELNEYGLPKEGNESPFEKVERKPKEKSDDESEAEPKKAAAKTSHARATRS